MWGHTLVFEQFMSVVASLSADRLGSNEGKLLSSQNVLNKILAYSHLFGIKAIFIYRFWDSLRPPIFFNVLYNEHYFRAKQ